MTPSIVFQSHKDLAEYKGPENSLDFIDHEVSVSLDSTNAFEGPEKLLEVWFAPTSYELPNYWPHNGLRSIPIQSIESMLDLVNCKILSKISSEQVDSYLLSESSLFVYPHKLILKTCGTTTTLYCLEKLLSLVKIFCNYSFDTLDEVYRIFYSRKSFTFPERQIPIHRSWESELNYLSNYFKAENHENYILGDVEKTTHWHLYINGTNKKLSNVNSPSTPESIDKVIENNIMKDFTLELLMSDLDSENSKKFQLSNYNVKINKNDDEGHQIGNQMMSLTGLNDLYNVKNIKHDSFAFSPCGYSSNSLLNGENYYTFHITPEAGWSFASFETNVISTPTEISNVVEKVVEAVKPGKFILVACVEEGSNAGIGEELQKMICSVDGYKRSHTIVKSMKFDYKLVYAFFEKN
ncbi:adenosylmethionine decarboxylase [Martiniozyma asiatica (nom. inval.)]|nr:adenosylmethionine decarboxylase [Martiniozyma asiatica]